MEIAGNPEWVLVVIEIEARLIRGSGSKRQTILGFRVTYKKTLSIHV
jgi:hypothetical protein